MDKRTKDILEETWGLIRAIMTVALFVFVIVWVFRATANNSKLSEEDVARARQEGYNEGYENGMNAMAEYTAGLIASVEEEKGVQEIQDKISSRYGVTPWEAWSIIDEYNYDWTHGGFTWEEYQNALEAVYDTAGFFPQTE